VITFITFLVVIGILIFFHELGHFLVAKLSGVRVEKFSLGFGPKLIGFKRGNTEYLVSLFPLGGYVKMAGEDPAEKSKGEEWEFLSKRVWQKLLIVVAGPISNIILAMFLFILVFMIGTAVMESLTSTRIGRIDPASPADEAGLNVGDRIISIGDQEIKDWFGLIKIMQRGVNRKLTVRLLRDKAQVVRTINPAIDKQSGATYVGASPYMSSEIGNVLLDYPAQEAGLKVGDKILKIDGKDIEQWYDAAEIIHQSAGKELTLEIERAKEVSNVNLTPIVDPDRGVGVIGISPKTTIRRLGFLSSIREGLAQTWYFTRLTYWAIWKLITGQVSLRTLGGPVMIAQLAGQAVKFGIVNLLMLIAIVSVNLGAINLLPIPVLDGGHVIFLFLEKVKGRPLSIRARELSQQIGLFILIALMIFVTFNDIMRALGG
jgi:regulator of sigma E protease